MNMIEESKRQDLGQRLVDREIYYCVSSLVSTLSTLAQHCDWKILRDEGMSWENDVLPLLEWTDYEEAGRNAIENAYLDELETLCESADYWDEACACAGFDSSTEYADSDGEMDTIDFQTWFDDHCTTDEKAEVMTALRTYIVDQVSDWQEFCSDNEVDTDDFRGEIYEHWLISDWLSRKLSEKGETVGELCGLTIWGRGCTGQSIWIDRVIQEIAIELWGDELLTSKEGE